MAVVDGVAYRLADEVVAYGPAIQAVGAQYLPSPFHVTVIRQGLIYVEVIPPARQLQPVEAPLPALSGELLQRQVGPLSREERYRSGHVLILLFSVPREPAPTA